MYEQWAPKRRYSNGTKTEKKSTKDRKQEKWQWYEDNKFTFEEQNKNGSTAKNITENEKENEP